MGSQRAGAVVAGLLILVGGPLLVVVAQHFQAQAVRLGTVEKMQKLGQAFHACHAVHKRLPPACDAFGEVYYPATVHVHLLPFLEETSAYRTFVVQGEGDSDAVLACYRSDDDYSLRIPEGVQNFAANLRVFSDCGAHTADSQDMTRLQAIEPGSTALGHFRNGTANTMIFATKLAGCGEGGSHFAAEPTSPYAPFFGQKIARMPAHASDSEATFQVTPPELDCRPQPPMAQSFSAEGLTVAMGDGSVRHVSPKISVDSWNKTLSVYRVQPVDGGPSIDW